MYRKPGTNDDGDIEQGNRSQVQGSTFRVSLSEYPQTVRFQDSFVLSMQINRSKPLNPEPLNLEPLNM